MVRVEVCFEASGKQGPAIQRITPVPGISFLIPLNNVHIRKYNHVKEPLSLLFISL